MSFNHLQTLKTADSKVSRQADTRHEQAEAEHRRGMALLEQVHRENFARPELLEDSLAAFLSAMRMRRQDLRNFLAAAYIFSIVNDFTTALDYVEAALGFEPDNEAAHYFRFVIREREKELKPAAAAKPVPVVQPAGPDYDSLYDQLESYLIKIVRKAMELPPFRPSAEPEQRKQIQTQLKQFRESQDYIRAQLAIIDEEIDTAELEQRARPLMQVLKRLESSYELSRSFARLKDKIQALAAEATEIEATILKGAATSESEARLESLLDRCDALADELDGYEAHGIEELLPAYERLLARVEDIREGLDG